MPRAHEQEKPQPASHEDEQERLRTEARDAALERKLREREERD
jgi:hypothetical protein